MNMPSLKPLALALLLLSSTPVLAEKTWKINLKDADIGALVTEMAEITGRNFVLDPRVKGTVTVVSSKALSAGELYELFQSVLAINGFAAVPSGPVVKILPDANARQSGVRVDGHDGSGVDQLVTRVILLQQASATELLNALRPMMPQSAHLAAVQGVNALVLSDRANNADAMEAIIRELDNGEQDDAIEIIPLRNGKADDLISVIETIEGGGAAAVGGNGKPVGKVRIIADDRSNRLIVRGDKALRERVRALARNLDEAPDMENDSVRVFRLKFANARQVAEVLKGIIAGENDKIGQTTTLQPTQGMSPGAGTTGGVGTTSGLSGTTGSTTGRQGGGTTTIMVGTSSLIADETQNALIVRAKPRQIRQIEAVLGDLDRRRSQVLIQAAIVEVSGDNAQQLGVQWAFGSPQSGVGVVNFSNVGSSLVNLGTAALTGDPTKATLGEGAAIGIGNSRTSANGDRTFYGALVQALNSVTDANLLSTPSIMTLDNQEAKIVVGQNVPFITGSTATVGSGVTNPFTTIQRQDVGITLRVTPSLSEGGTVKLDVEQEVSSVVPAADGIKSSDLITNKRSIKTSILADDGQTIVLGGLVQDDVKKSVSKVPFLGDIPYLGALFRSTSEGRTKRNLLVFLQPTIVRDAGATAALTRRQYDSVRRVDLGVDSEGRLTRLPPNIQDIYQGGVQRGGRSAPKPAAAAEPAAPAAQPAATVAPAPAPAPTPVPVKTAPVVEPQVYSAPLSEPIVATPMPASPSQSPRQSAPGYVPPAVTPSASARPYGDAATYAPAPAMSSPAAPTSDAGTPAPPVTSGATSASGATPPMRMIRTRSGQVYYVRDLPAAP